MKTRNTLFALALCTLTAISVGTAPSGARPIVPIKKVPPAQRQKFDTTRFVPESELHAGQKGYALTVFHGTKIERFGVEILGVMSKVNNGKDLILIRVTSGPSVSRQANIAAGMSGSPVYIGHRMVGAIAYSLPFAKEPIGLVTPIGDMLDAWDPDLPSKPSMALAATAAAAIPTPMNPAVTISNTALARYLGQIGGQSTQNSAQGTTTFEPVMTPVMVSGETAQGIAQLSSILGPLHLMPMAGGGPPAHISEAERRAAKLVPGAAVGVSLVQGDIDETAIGTLTYRDGNRVIAFGHPFTGIGPIDAALTTASITDLFPSYQDSTKLGSPLTTVGRIFQDRPFSVGGIIGSMPHMIPVSITIRDDSDNRTTYFHARVINHPLLTGSLISQVADQAILEAHGTPGDAIAMVTTNVDAEQVGEITRKNIFYDPLSIDQSAVGDLDSAMRLLSANPFYPLAVKSVRMSVTIESKHPTAQIDHIILPKASYAPGDTVNVGVVLKPYRRPNTLVTVPLTIPTTAPDGPVTVLVRGGATSGGTSISLGGTTLILKPATPVGPPAANITQLVHQYLEEPRNNDLVASLQLPSTALDVQGEKLSLLPPTMSAVMRSEHSSGLKVERDEIKKTLPMQWIISGTQSLTINVARKDTTDTTPSATTPGTPAPAADSTPPTQSAQADSADDSNDVSSADNPGDGGDNSGDGGDSGGDGGDSSAQASSGGWTGELMRMMLAPGAISLTPASVVHHSLPKNPATPSQDATQSSGSAASPATPDTTAAAQPAPPAAKPTPVGRVASIWRQDSAAAFGEGTLSNVIISSNNDLRLSASLSPLASSTAPYVWALASDGKGGLFAGTGDDGVVYKVSGSTMLPYFHTGQIEVSALAYDAKTGNLYAATAAHGAIFRISPDGHGIQIFTAPEKYVTALALDQKSGRLYAATGGGVGNVYVIPLAAPSTGKVLFASPEAHLQALAVGPDGTVYAGGSPDGLVYQITPDGKGSILYDASEPTITSLAVDSTGAVYAGTSPRGLIYKIVPAGSSAPTVKKMVPSAGSDQSNNPIYGLAVDGSGNIWACSGNDILRVPQDGSVLTYAAPPDVSFISLALGSDDRVYVGTSNIGTVYALGPGTDVKEKTSPTGTYTSPVHDAKLPSRWGTITWQAICPAGASIQLQTRSGDVAKPDSTWSGWSTPYTLAAGEQIASPPARFIQYRATIIGDPMAQPASLPRLQAVAIYYLTRNQAPAVKFVSPAGGDSLSGTVDLRWAGTDPDRDTLSYTILYSADSGKTWQPIKKALQSTPAPATQTKLAAVANTLQSQGITGASDADVAKAMAEFKQQLDQQTGIPPTVKEQMLAQAPGVIRQALLLKAGAPASTAAASTDTGRVTATDYHWNTKDVPDGTYQIKVIATDAPSNPSGALTDEAVSEPFVVDNTPPKLAIDPAKTTVDQQKRTVEMHGIATTDLSFVQAVQYKIDSSSDWSAASADSGLFDTRTAAFTINTPALAAGAHTITVEAIDQAGNTTTTTTQVMVP